ncbi:hypothetical protein B4Q13_21565, partial [Lacticaseibacillus rhamnosus]
MPRLSDTMTEGVIGFFLKLFCLFQIFSVLLWATVSSMGVTLLSDPVFTPSTNAVLAGTLRVSTDVPSRVSVAVSDGVDSWSRNFHDFGLTHTLTLAGFKPGRTNQIAVKVIDPAQNAQTAGQPLVFITPPLPTDFPHSVVVHSEPAKMEPGYTLFIVQNRTTKTA